MIAKITGIKKNIPGLNHTFTYVFFKMEDGKSARTSLVSTFGNYIRWKPVIDLFESGKEVWLKNLIWRNGKIGNIDADSRFDLMKEAQNASSN